MVNLNLEVVITYYLRIIIKILLKKEKEKKRGKFHLPNKYQAAPCDSQLNVDSWLFRYCLFAITVGDFWLFWWMHIIIILVYSVVEFN